MRGVVAHAGGAPAPVKSRSGRVLRVDPRKADERGWRLAEVVAKACGISVCTLLGNDRGKAGAALARQQAMYLMHTLYGRIYSEVGRFFGRDRTTVSHACALIEEKREEPEFERYMAELEAVLAPEAEVEQERARDAA